jgi:hypothetical protein
MMRHVCTDPLVVVIRTLQLFYVFNPFFATSFSPLRLQIKKQSAPVYMHGVGTTAPKA